MKHIEPPGLTYQKKNRLTCAPAPAAAPRGANVAKQPGQGKRLGRLYVIIIERLHNETKNVLTDNYNEPQTMCTATS